ncbi:MAG: Gfo/Idh/MocA family protein [Planctomycetota bacterium]|jgi:predicted dehydrogenase
MQTIKLALWGGNGHQIQNQIGTNDRLELIAFGAFDEEGTKALAEAAPKAVRCDHYEALLKTPGLELISLCSPRRCEQADHAIAAMEAGVSVYAEKPCALTEEELDRILAADRAGSAVFHEMAGTVFDQPYWAMREAVLAGTIGEVVQVFAQKSYPMYPGRPFEEAVDGGLMLQNGVHALRFVEHTTGLSAATIHGIETRLGDDREGSDLRMAASAMGSLENGGIYSVIMNYLNQPGLGRWGNEEVRIFGTRGMIESIDAGARVQLVLGDQPPQPVDVSGAAPDWFDLVCDHVQGENRFPFDLATELHPTRMVIRAKNPKKGA